jgi:uncharacterized protein (TIGR00730 family)
MMPSCGDHSSAEDAGDPGQLRCVCVYAGARSGRREAFARSARQLGALLASEGVEIVYGGGGAGLMGALADAALGAGGRVVGVIPGHLVGREVAHTGLSELVVVGSMHERKAQMAARAQAFIALPGGTGTLEELLEMLTWVQLGLHDKPIGLLDVEGYYRDLLAFLDGAVTDGLLAREHRDWLSVARDAGELVTVIAARLISRRPRGCI